MRPEETKAPPYFLSGCFYVAVSSLDFNLENGYFVAPASLTGVNYPDGMNMMSFQTSPRSALLFSSWGKWMLLQEIIQAGGRVAQLLASGHTSLGANFKKVEVGSATDSSLTSI